MVDKTRTLEIVLINPKFEVSYWGMEHALPLLGKKANLPVAGLPLLAALTPEQHHVTIVDENVEAIDFDRIAKADIVGITGMSVQKERMREIVDEFHQRGAFVVLGGPWITVSESYFGEIPKSIFVGEAEETWPQFLADFQRGEWKARYEAKEKTDMHRVPAPRYDLIKTQDYLFGSVQFSRGCPFQCEFCDIIVTFGRRPRIKTAEQILIELEQLLRVNLRIAFIVDDNLIGNKQQIKEVLKAVAKWQEERGFPLTFFTEASLDLADDPELMQLMVDCNIQTVFVGIESPNEASLRETKKIQNVRSTGTLLEKIHRIQHAGLDVWCGMIVGFDNDDASIFEMQLEFLRESRILHAMLGMLHAIPKTPLHERLRQEGRLDEDDASHYGTNVIPKQMTRDELRDGYLHVMKRLYDPDTYFDRLESLFLDERFAFGRTRTEYLRRHPWKRWKAHLTHACMAGGLWLRMMWKIEESSLRRFYRKRLFRLLRRHRNPEVWFVLVVKCAMHYHHYRLAESMQPGRSKVVNSF
ncbi:MAG: radical SAM protein [Pirellulales bacterium]